MGSLKYRTYQEAYLTFTFFYFDTATALQFVLCFLNEIILFLFAFFLSFPLLSTLTQKGEKISKHIKAHFVGETKLFSLPRIVSVLA